MTRNICVLFVGVKNFLASVVLEIVRKNCFVLQIH